MTLGLQLSELPFQVGDVCQKRFFVQSFEQRQNPSVADEPKEVTGHVLPTHQRVLTRSDDKQVGVDVESV